MAKIGIMDKKEAVFDKQCSSGQKGGCLFSWIFGCLQFLNYLCIVKLNGNGLCRGATYQG